MTTLIRRNRLDDAFGVAPFSQLLADVWGDFGATKWAPALNVSETADAYVVTAELPGVDPEKVEISLQDDRLELKGEKTVEERAAEGENWHRIERRHGAFTRTIVLPRPVDGTRVTAESKHGVLTITLPKREDAKPRKIEISTKS